MQKITKLKNLNHKTVLMRVDFNVPIKNNKVVDDFRIRVALPSIKFLLNKGAKIILITHFGKTGKESLEQVVARFFKIAKLSKSQKLKISFFDNIRKFAGEMNNDPVFAKKISRLGDIFVNDAFSVSHRKHASIVGIPKYLPSYAGLNLINEIKNLLIIQKKSMRKSLRPFLFILGGAKFSTKMPLIKKYLKIADKMFIAGALVNDFLKAMKLEIGRSSFSDNYNVKKILDNKKLMSKLIIPGDVFVQQGSRQGLTAKKFINKKINEIKKNDLILDIGRESLKNLKYYIKNAKFIIWNGPLGKYENNNGIRASREVIKAIARSKAKSIIGGGDTVELISEMKMQKKFNFISTGGGATLNFLLNGTLPGIEALK